MTARHRGGQPGNGNARTIIGRFEEARMLLLDARYSIQAAGDAEASRVEFGRLVQQNLKAAWDAIALAEDLVVRGLDAESRTVAA